MAFAECFLSYTVTVGENHSKSLILQLGERSEQLSEFGTFSFHETFLVNLNHCAKFTVVKNHSKSLILQLCERSELLSEFANF